MIVGEVVDDADGEEPGRERRDDSRSWRRGRSADDSGRCRARMLAVIAESTRIDSSPSRNTSTAMSTMRAVDPCAVVGSGAPPAVTTARMASPTTARAASMSATSARPWLWRRGGDVVAVVEYGKSFVSIYLCAASRGGTGSKRAPLESQPCLIQTDFIGIRNRVGPVRIAGGRPAGTGFAARSSDRGGDPRGCVASARARAHI